VAVFALLLALTATTAQAGQQLDTAESFAAAFAATLLELQPECNPRVAGPLEVRFQAAGGEQTAFLDNAYAEYRQAPDRRDAILAFYAQRAFDRPAVEQVSAADASRVMPVVRDAGYPKSAGETIAAQGGDPEKDGPLWEPLNEQLVVMYVLDHEHAISFLRADQLAPLGLKREELRARSVANLAAYLPQVEAVGGGGLFMLVADGTYEASLLLVDEYWAEGKLPVAGRLVVSVPSRDLLMVTGSDNAEGVARMREIAAEITAGGGRLISPELFVRRAGGWELLPPQTR